MIARDIQKNPETALTRKAAFLLIRPRQVGKITLAHVIADGEPSLYLDLENSIYRAKLAEPELFLAWHEDNLLILDEVDRVPEVFYSLRALVDKVRRDGRRTRRILLLGSQSLARPPDYRCELGGGRD